jgi:hypothetical protein
VKIGDRISFAVPAMRQQPGTIRRILPDGRVEVEASSGGKLYRVTADRINTKPRIWVDMEGRSGGGSPR